MATTEAFKNKEHLVKMITSSRVTQSPLAHPVFTPLSFWLFSSSTCGPGSTRNNFLVT